MSIGCYGAVHDPTPVWNLATGIAIPLNLEGFILQYYIHLALENCCMEAFTFSPIYTCSIPVVSASYLQAPRIHFAGRFRADVNTINNKNLNFLLSTLNQETDGLWNPGGSNTWAMIDCVVTSVVYEDERGANNVFTSLSDDSAIGLPLVNNPGRSFAKLVDVDPDKQTSSTIYGMDLGVNWDPSKSGDQVNAFIGDFVPAVITRDLWERQMGDLDQDWQQPFAGHSVSRLENVV